MGRLRAVAAVLVAVSLSSCGTETAEPAADPTAVTTTSTAPTGAPAQVVTDRPPTRLPGVAGEFARFADGGAAPAFADPVLLFIQGEQVKALRGDLVNQRELWEACPQDWAPTAHCAVSALDAIAAERRNRLATVITRGAPEGPCLIKEPANAPVFDGADDVVVLQPGSALRSCAYNYAVRLAVIGGTIAAVDLILNDP
jgi:hypothetical protein